MIDYFNSVIISSPTVDRQDMLDLGMKVNNRYAAIHIESPTFLDGMC